MCVLWVTGRKFDPEKYLASSRLTPYSVFRAGEPRFPSNPKSNTHEVSGFKIEVSRRPWNSLTGQIVDAIAFLTRHKRPLARLQSIPEVDDIRLDFPLDLRIDRRTVFAQYDYFPPKLVSLAGALGIGLELSIYPRDLEQIARRRKSSPRQAKPARSK